MAILVGLDLLLDPAAVALGFWSYAAGGAYYGVPLTNVLGWVLSASVVIIGLDVALDRARLAERCSTCPFMLDDLVSFALLWGVVAAMYGLIVPAALALGVLGVLSRVARLASRLRSIGGARRGRPVSRTRASWSAVPHRRETPRPARP